MLRHSIRRFSTTRRVLNYLKSNEEIDTFLNDSTWSIKELLKPSSSSSSSSSSSAAKEVSPEIIDKMLKLSGLSSANDIQNITKSLNLQMLFVNHLYDQLDNDSSTADKTEENVNDNNCMFRLLASDHVAHAPLNLKMIQEQIDNLKPDSAKGEIGFGIKDLQRDSFVIKKK